MEKEEQKKAFYANWAVLSTVYHIGFTAAVFGVFGVQSGLVFLLIALGSIWFLETINYLEHYGLMRSKQQNGKY